MNDNGYKFGNIRIPMVSGWLEKETAEWQPARYDPSYNDYDLEGHDYVVYQGVYSTRSRIGSYRPSKLITPPIRTPG